MGMLEGRSLLEGAGSTGVDLYKHLCIIKKQLMFCCCFLQVQ